MKQELANRKAAPTLYNQEPTETPAPPNKQK